MVEEKRRFSVANLFRRRTPTPKDPKVFNPGIQEKATDYMITSPVLYHVAQTSAIVRTCTTQLKNEIFRRGYQWKEAFSYKCEDCGHKHTEPVETCSRCKSINLTEPNPKQLQYAEKLVGGYINSSDQLFIDILKELEDDLNIMDDAYIVLKKEYYLDNNGKIRMHKIKEMFRGDPVTMSIYTDEDGEKGTHGFTCLNHREQIVENPIGICDECGAAMHPVYFVNRCNGIEQHYIKGEVLHFSKYNPSRLYGLSPVLTLWNNITTLLAMENYVNSSYSKSRMPRGLLAVQTRNIDSMKSFWRGVKEKMEQDPHFIPVMGIEAENGKGSIEWIKFMDSLKEMDYVAVKDDLRDRISGFYGVSKVFMSDNSASGGLNNEGMQILVTNRAVEMAQTIWNNYVFPFIVVEFGITDWVLMLPPSEEEDEIFKLRLREMEVQVAGAIKNLGFEVAMDDKGRFSYSKEKPDPQKPTKEGGEVELDPYAGTNVDQSQLGQMMEGGNKPSQAEAGVPEKTKAEPKSEPPKTRNKPGKSVGPDKRFSGLPTDAGNQNVDKRTERRIP